MIFVSFYILSILSFCCVLSFEQIFETIEWDWMFCWYDLWIGIYIDRKNKTAYVVPFPMLVIRIKLL